MNLELDGKLALVTGASRGIGRAVAESLAREGCRLVLVALNSTGLAEAAEMIREKVRACQVEVVSADLREAQAIRCLAEAFPNVDILVNNAGTMQHGSLLELDEKIWQDGWQLKVFGYIAMARSFYPLMKGRGSGVIINVIGSAGERVQPTYIAGSSGNAALIAFTKALGAASPADGIRVVGVNPGPILTDRLRHRLEKRAAAELGDAKRWSELTREFPFGRAGYPAEVADTVAFLASPRAGYISGSIVSVEGGMANRPVRT